MREGLALSGALRLLGYLRRHAQRVVFLRWDEEQSSVRLARSHGPTRDDGEERPISKERRRELLKEFAALPRTPDDPSAPGVPPLRYFYAAGGECDSDYVGGDTMFLQIDLFAALRAAPIEDARRVVMLWFRGPGPRAEKLFGRIEKLAK